MLSVNNGSHGDTGIIMTAAFRKTDTDQDGFYHFYDVDTALLPASATDFITQLPGPTVLHIKGKEKKGKETPCRVITSLLHGDNSNSLRTLLATMIHGGEPATDMKIVIISVEAAKLLPQFSHPFLPGQRDLNRCFRDPFICQPGHPANALLNQIEKWQPGALVDIHDSCVLTETFAISATESRDTCAVTSFFSGNLLWSPLKTGAITDLSADYPLISVYAPAEYTGLQRSQLYKGLMHFWHTGTIHPRQLVNVLKQPRRLELRRSAALTYSDKPVFGVNCTLRQDISGLSFTQVNPGDVLGWVDHHKLSHFRIAGRSPREAVSTWFCADDHCLTVTMPMMLIVVNRLTETAKSDCLFYFQV